MQALHALQVLYAASQARSLATRVVNTILPPTCLACDAHLPLPGALCAGCWTGVTFIERPFCEALGTPFAFDLGPGALSADAIATPPVWRRSRSAVVYGDTATQMVSRLKYSDRTDLARWMARMMVRPARELVDERTVIVPVPLHRRRLVSRMFNQSAELGRALSRELDVPMRTHWLERKRATPAQVGRGREARLRNVAGAFEVPAGAKPDLTGRPILLVDDVLTTGATLGACARALLRGGAASVDCLTFARVVPD